MLASHLLLIVVASVRPAVGPIPKRDAWYACLDAYAQTQLAGSTSPQAVASGGLFSCWQERREFQIARWRIFAAMAGKKNSSPRDLNSAFAKEDRLAAVHIINLVVHFRQ